MNYFIVWHFARCFVTMVVGILYADVCCVSSEWFVSCVLECVCVLLVCIVDVMDIVLIVLFVMQYLMLH